MQFKSVEAYLEALRRDPALAMIPMGMVAELRHISRSAVSEQIKTGRLEAIVVKGRRKTWRGVTPSALFAQDERAEAGAREQRRLVAEVLARAAAEGRLLTYSQVMEPAGLAAKNPRDRGVIGALLSDLSRESWQARGHLIGAIVIQKASGHPNALFFDLAREVGALGQGEDPVTFWHGHCAQVFAAHAPAPVG